MFYFNVILGDYFMAKLYFKLNTSDTAMNGDGIRDFENEFPADDIAKTLMSMYLGVLDYHLRRNFF